MIDRAAGKREYEQDGFVVARREDRKSWPFTLTLTTNIDPAVKPAPPEVRIIEVLHGAKRTESKFEKPSEVRQ